MMQLSRGSGADLETRCPREPALVFIESEQFGRLQVERRGDVEHVETAVTAGFRMSVWPITLSGTKLRIPTQTGHQSDLKSDSVPIQSGQRSD